MSLQIIFLIIAINTAVIIFGIFYIKNKLDKIIPIKEDLKVVVFDELKIDDGLLKKSISVKIKQQFYYRGIPIGEPVTMSENTYDSIDKDRIEKLLNDYAKPLLDIGVAIVEFKSAGILGKFKNKK
jgi:hypothetical protein